MEFKIKSVKLKLYKILNGEQPYENSIKISLISTYSELIEILNSIEKKTKFFYLDNVAIFEIMYQAEEVVPIENKRYDYSFIYYLCLLIKENKEMVNFKFGIDFIKEIIKENNNQKNELLKLLLSKIILDLIYSYEGMEKNEELKKIKEENKMYIRDNIKLFNIYNLNLENFEEISLGKLYLDILIELIKNKKLEDYKFANDILTKLNLENIDINQNMFEELKYILDDERYINDYKINNIEDFFVETKINFYYMLIKYIFKNSFFIYNIPLFYNLRILIMKIIKMKKKEFLSYYNIENFDLVKRINYNIKFILDSNYYLNIFNDIIFDKILEKAFKNNSENWKEYLKDLNISGNIIDKIIFFNYIYKSKIKDEEKIEFKEIQEKYKKEEQMIKDKRIKKMRKDDKLILSKYFIDNNNKDSLLRIFGQDSYNYFLKESNNLYEKEKEKEKKRKNEQRNKLKLILDYYKTFFFESKKEDINSIEDAISDQGDLNYKINESDFEKAKFLNDRMPLINYIYSIKDGNKTESEMQEIIENYNSLEKSISERKSMKDINIENETKSQLIDYFNDKNNKDFLIKIFGKENYEFAIQNFNEKMNDENFEKYSKIITDKPEKKIKEDYNGIKNQNNIKNDSLNLLSASTKMNSKSIQMEKTYTSEQPKSIQMEKTNNSEQPKSIEEKLASLLLKKSEVILNTKNEGEKLSFIYDRVSYGDHHIFISYDKLLQIKEYFIKNKIESIIAKSYTKYMEFLDEFKNRIDKEFTNEYKLKIDLKFQKIYKNRNDQIFNINCYYIFYSRKQDEVSNQIFIEENILLNKTNSKTQGFEYLITEINDEYYKEIKFPDNSPKENNTASDNYNQNENNNNNTYANNNNDESENENISETKDTCIISDANANIHNKVSNIYNIVKIDKIEKVHTDPVEFILELSNGYFFIGGGYNTLKIYDKKLNLKKEIENINESVYSCYERKISSNQKNKKKKEIEVIICCCTIIKLVIINFKDEDNIYYDFQKFSLVNLGSKNCIQMRENSFVLNGYNNSNVLLNLFNSEATEITNLAIVSGKSYIGSIKINKNITAVTSNKVQSYGENKLIFFNIDKKKISREIEGYSFTYGINGLALMPREEVEKKNKILLCACTRYINDQRNGIYLANPQLEDNKGVNRPFYDTGNFEVFCFCPILIINPKNYVLEEGKKIEIKDTDYFFVGGFNEDKKEGEIKLFKVIYSERAIDNKIEFVQDIEFERNNDFNGFDGAVSCIIQAKYDNTGKILVTCYNGKAYLLTKPNLDFYKDTENKNEKNKK